MIPLPRGAFFVPMEAYLDESGIHKGSKRWVLAGYSGGVRKFRAFEVRWLGLLERFAIEKEHGFHAKEFFQPNNAIYSKWKERDRYAFIDLAVALTAEHHLTGFGCAITSEFFFGLSHTFRRFITGGNYDFKRKKWLASGAPDKPYFFAMQQAAISACKSARPGVRVEFIFDRQENFRGWALQLWDQLKALDWETGRRLGGIAYHSRLERPCLQVADLLAFSMYHVESYSRETNKPLVRYAIHRLLESGLRVTNLDHAIRVIYERYPEELRKLDDDEQRTRKLREGDGNDSPRRS